MRADWEEVLDLWEEKELAYFLPESLPELDDAIYQRIEKRTLRRIQKERSRISRKQIAAAVICLVAILGIVGREPIQAAFEKLFHYLPGAGIYTNDAENTMYRAEMITDHFEENGVQVRLKNVYGENQTVKLEVELRGDDLGKGILEGRSESKHLELLEEKYQMTLSYDGKEQVLSSAKVSFSGSRNEGKYVMYSMGYEVQVENPARTYEVHIAGFDSVLSFTLVPDTGMVQPENIGASQTKNGITVTAGAEVTEDGIWFEYYVLSDERLAETDETYRFTAITLPYGYFRWNDVPEAELYQQRYVMNGKGEMLYPRGHRWKDDVENGKRILYEGTAEDFPLTFYQAAFTGVGEERETLKIPVPETNAELSKTIDFPYGTVTLEQIQTQPADGVKELEIIYRIQPKEGKRKMYGVFMQVQEAVEKEAKELTIFPEEDGTYHFPVKISPETKEITLELYDPYYWIVDDYTLVIEAPNETK